MPVIHLVRHGQASFGAQDYDNLSDLGRAQAVVVGQALSSRGLRAPVAACGTLRRQRDTAALALAHLTPQVDPRWDEYDHLDLLKRYARPDSAPDGSSASLQRMLDAALAEWVRDGDSGGWPAFATGATEALADLAATVEKGCDAVVFTSGGVVAAVCAGLLGLDAPGVVALNRAAVNAAVTKLAVGASGTTLLSFNEHSHLDPASVTYR